MDGFLIRFAFSLLFSCSIAARALKRKSVDFSAVFVGIPAMVMHMLAGYRFAALLLVFFSTSSKVTKLGQEKKRVIEADFKEGGQRNWEVTVLSETSRALGSFGSTDRPSTSQEVIFAATGRSFLNKLYNMIIIFQIPGIPETKVQAILDTGATNCCICANALPKDAFDEINYKILFSGINSQQETNQKVWLILLYRIQVLANSLIATVLVVILNIKTQGQDKCLDTEDSTVVTALLGGIVGHYACCNGDTWSSELGMLSSDQPRLITTFKKVRKGTNGAITIHGLVAAIAAGFAIGITFALIGLLTTECSLDVLWRQLLIVPIAAAAGLIGSLIDSLLGATLQFSGYCTVRKKVVGKHGPTVIKISGTSMLDNNAVNAVSILLTTLVTSITCLYIF